VGWFESNYVCDVCGAWHEWIALTAASVLIHLLWCLRETSYLLLLREKEAAEVDRNRDGE